MALRTSPAPRLRIPAVVLEIVGGIALGLLRRDEPDPAALPDVTAPVAEPHLM